MQNCKICSIYILLCILHITYILLKEFKFETYIIKCQKKRIYVEKVFKENISCRSDFMYSYLRGRSFKFVYIKYTYKIFFFSIQKVDSFESLSPFYSCIISRQNIICLLFWRDTLIFVNFWLVFLFLHLYSYNKHKLYIGY